MKSFLVFACVLGLGCGDDADSLGIGAQCTQNDQCDGSTHQICLPQFKGGYCGLQGCVHDTDCPADSACVAHTDGQQYCFRTCAVKPDCNANRDALNESNCSSSATLVDAPKDRKVCVPPSGG